MSVFSESFDDFLSTERQMENLDIPPFQFREDKTEEGTHEWLTQNFDNMEHAAHSRRITYRRYQALYKNIHWRFFDTRDTRRDQERSNRRPRHSVNFIREMVDNRCAQNARMKHNLAFIPHNDEQSDVNNAKLCKIAYDGYAEENELEVKHNEQDQVTFLFGHSFMWIDWDPEMGPYHPAYMKLMDKYEGKLPADIKKKLKKEEIRVGDVRVNVLGPDRVYPERNKTDWKDMDYCERIDFIDKEQLKADYPKKAHLITDNQRQIYDFDSAELIRPQNIIVTRTFYHKPTKYFPKGCKIVYNDDCILEWIDFPFEHGMLPAIPDTDIDIYSEFWGRSFIQDIEQQQRFYNAMQSAQARDFSWASAPKWLMPKGACDVNSLNNDLTIVEFTGPVAPVVATHQYTPPQTMELQDRIEKRISRQSKVYDISRGEVPSGVTANSALRFLDEQESQVILPQETKRKRRVIKSGRMILELMKQYYSPGDNRTVRLIGSKNEHLIKSMKKADFTRIYDVKAQNTSALPDTKTGKIAAIIDLNTATQTDPIFRKEEVIEMLDLGNDKYFKDRASIAVDTANAALDAMMEGEQVAPPKIFDELLVYYSVFCKGIQHYSFKERIDDPTRAMVESYIQTLEMHMFERCKVNMKFCMEVLELNMFPMFFKPPMPMTKVLTLHQQDSGQMAPPQGGEEIKTDKVEKIQEQG